MLKNSMIKLACISIPLKLGVPQSNANEIINALKNSKAMINLFPELTLTGYSCGDLFFNSEFLTEVNESIKYVVQNNPSNGIVVFGAPILHEGSLYNCAIVVLGHKILGIVPKTHLPNYPIYQEKRWFKEGFNNKNDSIYLNGEKYPFGNLIFKDYSHDLFIGVEICEDMWNPLTPGSYLSLAGANVLLNLSSSDEYIGKEKSRLTCVLDNSRKNVCAYAYSSSSVTESSASAIFSGHKIISVCGEEVTNNLSFADSLDISYADIDLGMINYERRTSISHRKCLPNDFKFQEVSFILNETLNYEFEKEIDKAPFIPKEDGQEVFNKVSKILQYSLKKRLEASKVKTLVIGVSGGLDSTLALLIAHSTFKMMNLDCKNIIGVTMPCFGTTNRTKNNAVLLMEKLGITVLELPISDEINSHFDLIGHDKNQEDVTYENAQARYRTMVLMNLANKYNGLVLGTGDMSELALGWCTYNGDQMSMYAINSGMPKTFVRYMTQAYALYAYLELKDVISDIINTPISPELLTNQNTEDFVGKYEVNDFILHRVLFCGDSKNRISWLLRIAFKLTLEEANEYVDNFFKRFYSQQFKRTALPDGPKVFKLSLSSRDGLVIPSDLDRR